MKNLLIALFFILYSINVGAQILRCTAQTKKGEQCRRKAVKEGLCSQHYRLKTGIVVHSKPKVDLPEEWQAISTDVLNPDFLVAYRDTNTNIIYLYFKH